MELLEALHLFFFLPSWYFYIAPFLKIRLEITISSQVLHSMRSMAYCFVNRIYVPKEYLYMIIFLPWWLWGGVVLRQSFAVRTLASLSASGVSWSAGSPVHTPCTTVYFELYLKIRPPFHPVFFEGKLFGCIITIFSERACL